MPIYSIELFKGGKMIKLGICLLVFWGVLIVKIQAETINNRGKSFKLGNQVLCIDENNNNKFCQEYFEIFEKTSEKYKNMIKQPQLVRIFNTNQIITDMKKRQKELLKNILEGLEIAGYIIVGTVLMWIAFFLICITGDL